MACSEFQIQYDAQGREKSDGYSPSGPMTSKRRNLQVAQTAITSFRSDGRFWKAAA